LSVAITPDPGTNDRSVAVGTIPNPERQAAPDKPMIHQTPTVELLIRDTSERYGVARNSVRVVRAPYRICPLGAHIDHQLGPVTAMAIDQSVLLAYAPSRSLEVFLTSLDFPGSVRFSLDDVPARRADDWGNFPRGAASSLQRRHSLDHGIVGMTSGRLHGGGVSSSAAVGIAFLLAFEDVNGLSLSSEENIELDRWIENDYLGLRNGILDPAAVLLSRRGHLTEIDCRASCHKLIPSAPTMPPFKILLAFSGVRKTLMGTDYNRRVDECAIAARTLLDAMGRSESEAVLGNVRSDEYVIHQHALREIPARRAAHFFSEVDRVRKGIEAWRNGDLIEFGSLVTASGKSSILNYECGSPPLIDLFHILIETEGVFGARFSGAGFRGCCVALVAPGSLEVAAARVAEAYARRHPNLAARASVVLCDTDDGAEVLECGRDGRRGAITEIHAIRVTS
jgi:galacturonokinase